MAQVSEQAEDLLYDLMAWEFLGADLDPRVVLRQVSLADLCVVQSNLEKLQSLESATVTLLGIELAYRTGKLVGDWEFTQDGEHANVKAQLKEPLNFILLNFTTEAIAQA